MARGYSDLPIWVRTHYDPLSGRLLVAVTHNNLVERFSTPGWGDADNRDLLPRCQRIKHGLMIKQAELDAVTKRLKS